MGRLPAISAGLCTALLLTSCAGTGGESGADDGALSTSAPAETDQSSSQSSDPNSPSGSPSGSDPSSVSEDGEPFIIEEQGSYDAPWALEFLPGTEQMLISTRTGGQCCAIY